VVKNGIPILLLFMVLYQQVKQRLYLVFMVGISHNIFIKTVTIVNQLQIIFLLFCFVSGIYKIGIYYI